MLSVEECHERSAQVASERRTKIVAYFGCTGHNRSWSMAKEREIYERNM